MNKKPHLIYSLLSICAVVAYSTFLIHNAVTDTNKSEELVPYKSVIENQERLLSEAPTEPLALTVTKEAPSVPYEHPEEKEIPTEKATEPTPHGFSPIFPVEGEITREFYSTHKYDFVTRDWRSHPAIDISASAADRVLATEDGTVTKACQDPLWGNVIEIDHGEYVSVYKNLSTLIMVKEGDFVSRGQAISGVGATSAAEGYFSPHLHFEILHFGEYIDPLSLLPPIS